MRLSLVASVALLLAGPALAKNAADYYVRSLPGQPAGPLIKMHAGHIEVDPKNKGNLFFWHFQNKHIGDRQRTVIWLNGGPGCSSMDGALMEVGPYRLKDDHTLEENPGSWHEFANVMFVDQPVGTGYSYVNTDHYLHELSEMADQFLSFLTTFFELFPEYELDDIYIAGESYAGQHIPYIADAIMKRNADVKKANTISAVEWNIKGLLIGNGWIDPVPQYMSYLKFAYEMGLVERDSDMAKSLEKQQSICEKALSEAENQHSVDIGECEKILQDTLQQTVKKNSKGEKVCYNMYDVRKTDTYPSCGMNWPPDLANMTPYLRRQDVKNALHVNPDKTSGWTECAGSVSSSFRARNSKPAVELLPGLLEHMPITLFSGDQDMICNHIGTEESIHALEWNGGKGFETEPGGTWAPRSDWTFEGEPAGYYQSARNLTYVLFYNASHMVPFDFPRRTRDMLDRFMGVDIASIGGQPTDSRIGGEKGPVTSVGGHPNSTAAQEKEAEKLDAARWEAYYHSGEVALILVASSAAVWGVFIWRQRANVRRRKAAGYHGVGATSDQDVRLEEGDFDEARLDDLDVSSGRREERRYSLGGASSDEDDDDSAGDVKKGAEA